MALSQHDIDLIERALDNDLSDAEKLEFDQELKNSKTFKQAYEDQLNLLGHLVAHKKQEIRKELKELYTDFKKDRANNETPRQIHFLKYGIAASIIIAASVSFWVINRESKSSFELYNEYYEPFHGGPLLRGEEEDSVQMALSAYYGKDYQLALSLFSTLEHPKKLLLIGNCYLNLERYEEAEKAFMSELQNTKSDYHEPAKWYLALLYLKQGEKDKAEKLLKEFNEGYYYQKAAEVLEELD